ncbi:hypothetical protein HA466_0158250 [Hirschfeldia incana]|nr:hypothetical protein HA466_0158250 [Hirschfeldia incana]
MMICFKCRHTREHTYCTRLFSSSVHPIWMCEACRLPPRVMFVSHVAEDLMDTETTVADPKNTRVDDHGTTKLRANNDMEEVGDTREALTRDSSCEISASVNNTVRHSSPLAKDTLSSQTMEQHQPTQAVPRKRRTIRVMGKHHSQSRDRTPISPLDHIFNRSVSPK